MLALPLSGLSAEALALLAGAVGAVVGTAVGILSAVWAYRAAGAEPPAGEKLNGSIRVVSDELLRLAAAMERCTGEVGPARGLDLVHAADLQPPLRAWQSNQA